MFCSSTVVFVLIIAVTADMTTDVPISVPDQITGPFEESIQLIGDYFNYEFNFSAHEDRNMAKPVAFYGLGKWCPDILLPPVPDDGTFRLTTPTRYAYRTKIHKGGKTCIYKLQIYLKTPEGVKGIPYLTYINLTDGNYIEGMQSPDTPVDTGDKRDGDHFLIKRPAQLQSGNQSGCLGVFTIGCDRIPCCERLKCHDSMTKYFGKYCAPDGCGDLVEDCSSDPNWCCPGRHCSERSRKCMFA